MTATKTPPRSGLDPKTEAVADFTADKLADHERERAALPVWIREAAGKGDVDALTAIQARATALDVLIPVGRVRVAERVVLEAETAISEAEAEREVAYAALDAANARLEAAKAERTRLAGDAEDARETVREARHQHAEAHAALGIATAAVMQ